MSEALIQSIAPTAAELVVAVADRDRDAVSAALIGLTTEQLHALAITLAASVDQESPLMCDTIPMSPEVRIEHAIDEAARRFDTTPARILSTSRFRNDVEARQVAIAALRLSGLSSPAIGAAFGRDHSTVLYAATRVGESPKLRRISQAVAAPITASRGVLGDEHLEVVA